ncbi:hypothetical protein [uncultured Croceitalea sp.]|uniref:hypothetical protein n=1 Tax=uncultured Croceitalea sp. TaxID=1798908 RepID=UPI00330600C0
MSNEKTPNTDSTFIVKAIEIETNKVICEGSSGEEVIKEADESGKNYILDFESEPRYNFLF